MQTAILRAGTVLYLVAALSVLLVATVSPTAAARNPEIVYYTNYEQDYEIYLLDVNRGLSANLTHNPGDDTRPAWSPDGQQIVFYSYRNRRTDLYILNVDTGSLRRLVASGGPGAYPAWSSDGQWIAFASIQSPGGGIYRIHPDGSGLQHLTALRASLIVWSPDSQRMVFTSDCDNNCDIYVMDADGSHSRRLTNTGEYDVYPVWSPDSRRIAFMSNRDGNLEVYEMDTDCDETLHYSGCAVNRLTVNRGFDGFPSWSSDGKWIAFDSDRDGNFEIYTLAANCYQQSEGCLSGSRLTFRKVSDIGPIWSPDGRQLAFISALDLMVINPDGSGLRRLARGVLRDQFLVWRP